MRQRVFDAYEQMVDDIRNRNFEFSIAHENACYDFNLNDEESRELIDMYDRDEF